MKLDRLIREHRDFLDDYIRALGGPDEPTHKDRVAWVNSDSALKEWAQQKGVQL